MVNNQTAALDRTFAALADPTRRALLARLERADGATVSDLARPFAMTLPAVLKHLGVLEEAGLVSRSKAGRTVTVRLEAGPMEDALAWLERYRRFWTGQLDRLTAFVEDDTWTVPTAPPKTAPASPSAAGSRRRPPKSMPRGRKRS